MNRALPADDTDPREFLPLTPAELHVLLALAAGERHGYAILQEVERHGPEVRLRTGTLYTVLKRMLDSGWVADSAAGRDDDARRRYYRLTPLGARVLRAEVRRLDALVALARERRLLGRAVGLGAEKAR